MVGKLGLLQGVLALILSAVAAVAVNAQIVSTPQTPPPHGYCTGGPFPLTGGEAKFHVVFDDDLPAPSMNVTLRLYDAEGSRVAWRTVTLSARKAATLEFRGAGLFWAQASYDTLLDPSPRRRTVGSVEVSDIDGFRAVIPVLCIPNDNIR